MEPRNRPKQKGHFRTNFPPCCGFWSIAPWNAQIPIMFLYCLKGLWMVIAYLQLRCVSTPNCGRTIFWELFSSFAFCEKVPSPNRFKIGTHNLHLEHYIWANFQRVNTRRTGAKWVKHFFFSYVKTVHTKVVEHHKLSKKYIRVLMCQMHSVGRNGKKAFFRCQQKWHYFAISAHTVHLTLSTLIYFLLSLSCSTTFVWTVLSYEKKKGFSHFAPVRRVFTRWKLAHI